MKYFFVTGEVSGDLHSSHLAKEILKQDSNAQMVGWGSSHLEKAGVKLYENIAGKAIMGFVEVIANLNGIRKDFATIKSQIIEFQPDVLVLVDYGGFNLKLAKWAKKNTAFKIAYFIPPKAWAWQKNRVHKLKKYTDLVLCIFPFEVAFFKEYGINAVYAGNPSYYEVKSFQSKPTAAKKTVALLPGSRPQEIKNMLSKMLNVIPDFPEHRFVVAGLSDLDPKIYSPIKNKAEIVYDDTYSVLANSYAALVTSGTATLETALFNVPQVVVYKTNAITFAIAKTFVKIKFISLVNIIAEKAVVKELIQNEFNLESLKKELNLLLKDNKYREKQFEEYKIINQKLENASFPNEAANQIINLLKK